MPAINDDDKQNLPKYLYFDEKLRKFICSACENKKLISIANVMRHVRGNKHNIVISELEGTSFTPKPRVPRQKRSFDGPSMQEPMDFARPSRRQQLAHAVPGIGAIRSLASAMVKQNTPRPYIDISLKVIDDLDDIPPQPQAFSMAPDGPMKCPTCFRYASSLDDLRRHQFACEQSRLKGLPLMGIFKVEKKPFICMICSTPFKSSTRLNNHLFDSHWEY